MSKNQFKEMFPITRENAKINFRSGIPDEICNTLVRITFSDPDWSWIQEMCLDFVNNSNVNVRACAVTCLGHTARIHGKLDLDKVVPLLEKLRDDSQISSIVEDAFDDILTFVR